MGCVENYKKDTGDVFQTDTYVCITYTHILHAHAALCIVYLYNN